MTTAEMRAALTVESTEANMADSLGVTLHVLRRNVSQMLLATNPTLFRELVGSPEDSTTKPPKK